MNKLPRVLLAIHGYPPRYNAGSEVYTQTLALGLAEKGVKVDVFAREEDPFSPDYAIRAERDQLNRDIPVFLVNHARSNIRYANKELDNAFHSVVKRTSPDIIHMGHLNHLSTGMVDIAKGYGVPVVFTLHDFWLMCPRGQFLKTQLTSGTPWELCDGQEDRKCATQCYNRFHSGDVVMNNDDEKYWTEWISKRMEVVRKASEKVDLFVAPSEHLRNRFVNEFHIPLEKIKYLDYGFDVSRLTKPKPRNHDGGDTGFVFGYIGRHHPSKGIDMLISAFANTTGKSKLIIWGRPDGQLTSSLQRLAKSLKLVDKTIEWRTEYKNEHIVRDVFEHCDCIVVPSIWDENSPLVIHEAQQIRMPVITSDHGGMGEFVKDGINGFTFPHRNTIELQKCLQKAIDNPSLMTSLGLRGYIKSASGDIPSVQEHVDVLLSEYEFLLEKSKPKPLKPLAAPWRITFDTNPDDCNLQCIMCEDHSKLSKTQEDRKKAGKRRRRMDLGTLKNVVAECAGKGLQEIIPSTMGEPLMYKQFPEIIEICKQYNVKLNLTTNGTFIGRGVTEWAKMIVPVASDVKISWNGASGEVQDKVMVGSKFSEKLANLKEFICIRNMYYLETGKMCTITLQLTFMEMNVHELPDVVRLGIELGVDRIKGHHLWAHFEGIQDQSMRRNSDAISRWNKIARECIEIANTTPLPPLNPPVTTTPTSQENSSRKIKLENIYELKESESGIDQIHPQAECPFLGKEAWVNHSGRFDPCCAPDLQRRTLGSFGDVHTSGLLNIWNSPAYKNLVNEYHHKDVCKGCNMRKPPSA